MKRLKGIAICMISVMCAVVYLHTVAWAVGASSVSEPVTLLMVGSGLIGLARLGKKLAWKADSPERAIYLQLGAASKPMTKKIFLQGCKKEVFHVYVGYKEIRKHIYREKTSTGIVCKKRI